MELTQANISTAATGAVLRCKIVPGLHVRVKPSGKKFFLSFRTRAGIERRPKLGEHPNMTLTQARAVARELLVKVAAGYDPVGDWQREKASPSVKELVDQYELDHARDLKSGADIVKTLRLHVVPRIGTKKVGSVTYDDMKAIHDALKKTPYMANRVLSYSSKMFSLAETPWGYRTNEQGNPCKGVRRYAEKKRRRYATAGECRAIADILDKYVKSDPASVAFIYLLILSGARKSEIANARWTILKGNVLHLEDSKTGAKPVFLPPQAMAVLAELPVTSGTLTGIKNPKKLWGTVRKRAGCPDLRMHDLRHSFASAALDAGYTLEQIGELLGHASVQTTKRYAHLIDTTAQAAVAKTASMIEAKLEGRGDI